MTQLTSALHHSAAFTQNSQYKQRFCFVLFCYFLFIYFFYVKDLLDLLVTEMSRLSSEGINVYFSLTLFDQ